MEATTNYEHSANNSRPNCNISGTLWYVRLRNCLESLLSDVFVGSAAVQQLPTTVRVANAILRLAESKYISFLTAYSRLENGVEQLSLNNHEQANNQVIARR